MKGPVKILAIDPGSEKSAYVFLIDADLGSMGLIDNRGLMTLLTDVEADHIAIEVPRPRGRTFSQVIATTLWIGRFLERARHIPFTEVDRKDVKNHFKEGKEKMNDSKIRTALIERWGGKEKAIGSKKAPGPLYHLKADIWQALAVGLTYAEGGCKSPNLHTPSIPAMHHPRTGM